MIPITRLLLGLDSTPGSGFLCAVCIHIVSHHCQLHIRAFIYHNKWNISEMNTTKLVGLLFNSIQFNSIFFVLPKHNIKKKSSNCCPRLSQYSGHYSTVIGDFSWLCVLTCACMDELCWPLPDDHHAGGPVGPDVWQTVPEALLLCRRHPHRHLPHRAAGLRTLWGAVSVSSPSSPCANDLFSWQQTKFDFLWPVASCLLS